MARHLAFRSGPSLLVAVAAAAQIACSSSSDAVSGARGVDGGQRDSGLPRNDSGTSAADGASHEADAHAPRADTGAPSTDGGGASKDSGTAICMPHADGALANPLSGLGKATWGRSFGGERQSSVAAGLGIYVGMAVAPSGSLQLGPKLLIASSGSQIVAVIADLDASHDPVWADGIEAQTVQTLVPIVRASGKSAAIGFVAKGSVTVGGATLDLGTSDTLVVALLDGTGHATWMKPIGKVASTPTSLKLRTDAAGNIYGAASFASGETVGGRALDCDAGLFALTAAGAFQYARCVSPARGSVYSVDTLAADGAGNVYLSGFPKAGLDVGTGPLSIDSSAGASFLAKVGPDGKTVWAKAVLRAYADSLVVASDGTLFISGDLPQQDARNGLIDIDGHTYLPCNDGFHTHITRIAPDGAVVWSRAWGARPTLLAVSDQYDLLFTAQVLDAPSVAERAVTSAKPPYLGVVGASGTLRWLNSLTPPGGTGQSSAAEAAPLLGGGFVVGGMIGEPLTLGADVIGAKVGGSDLVFGVAQ